MFLGNYAGFSNSFVSMLGRFNLGWSYLKIGYNCHVIYLIHCKRIASSQYPNSSFRRYFVCSSIIEKPTALRLGFHLFGLVADFFVPGNQMHNFLLNTSIPRHRDRIYLGIKMCRRHKFTEPLTFKEIKISDLIKFTKYRADMLAHPSPYNTISCSLMILG